MEFQTFESIEILESLITISEKIHGTNAQIAVDDLGKEIYAGSRERWVTPEDDNHGFANWVFPNKEALIKLLGPGRHYGEWYGPGIGPGYGLKEKRFALFNTHRWGEATDLLPRMDVVPVLYRGTYKPNIVKETMDKLKESGSKLVPGYMKPEGVVIYYHRTSTYFKQVFEKETVSWDRKEKKEKAPIDPVFEAKVMSYLQPIRLEKLVMRDENYLKNYPKSMGMIAKDYVTDLIKESDPIDEVVLKGVKKKVFSMIRETYGK